MKIKIAAVSCLLALLLPAEGPALEMADYLVLQDIGAYKMDRPDAVLLGEPPLGGPQEYPGAGVLSGTGHFPDHIDTTYEVLYRGGPGAPSPVVTVTRHAGGEADAWLLHELEQGLRGTDDEEETLGLLHGDASMMSVGNSTIFRIMGVFTWVSKNTVVEIEGDYLQTGPLEVVWAYVQKLPSTIPESLELSREHDIVWIKDEMERRLWLSNRWFARLRAGTAQPKQALKEAAAHLRTFLDYRSKYYGIQALEEKRLLFSLLEQSDDNGMYERLKDCQKWWAVNKQKQLTL